MSVTISMKAPEELAERIEDAREDGESRSACIRRLTREALEAENSNPHGVTLPILLFWFGSVAIASQYVSASGLIGPAGFVMMGIGVILYNQNRHDRVKDAIERYTDSDDTQSGSESGGTTAESE